MLWNWGRGASRWVRTWCEGTVTECPVLGGQRIEAGRSSDRLRSNQKARGRGLRLTFFSVLSGSELNARVMECKEEGDQE